MIAARALEQFLEELITKTAAITMSLQAKTLTPEHIRQNIYNDVRLSFLHDLANRMATGPNNGGRSLSTSSSITPPVTTNRAPFQQQLSVPYQDPLPLPSATSSNLIYLNHPINRSYSNQYYSKAKSNKRRFELVDDEQEDEDETDDNDDEDGGGGGSGSGGGGGERLISHRTTT